MKKILTLLICLLGYISYAQQKIVFGYDEAGNQVSRVICMRCAAKNSNPIKNISDLEDEDLQKFSPNDGISYYPNPVKEELFLKWEFTSTHYVSDIKLFNLNGSLLKSFENLNGINQQSILFLNYPEGVYVIELVYNTGDVKSIKIIKQ